MIAVSSRYCLYCLELCNYENPYVQAWAAFAACDYSGLPNGFHSLRCGFVGRVVGVATVLKRCIGYDQGVFSGIVGNKDFLKTMNSEQRRLKLPLLRADSGIDPNDSLTGIIVSIYDLGCFAGCIINFMLGDWLGRRRAMWFAMGWIVVKLGNQSGSHHAD
jgi:hypothetical protein